MSKLAPAIVRLTLSLSVLTFPAWSSVAAPALTEPGLDGGTLPFAFPDGSGRYALPGNDARPNASRSSRARDPANAAGITAPLVPPTAKPSETAEPKGRKAVLDGLFERLQHAEDTQQADGVALAIQHVWLESGSDTADLLMTRAVRASELGDTSLAIRLLDTVVVLDPDWAEGWNRRATLRFIANDDAGSMEDIGHVLALEPRHFGAMTGMATIMLRHGMKKDALAVLRKAADVYPHNADMMKLIDSLVPEVEGQPI